MSPFEASLPPNFVKTQIAMHAESGRALLRGLPSLLDEYARRWSIELAPAFSNLSFHYVAPGIRHDGTPVVLKAGIPHPEMRSEIAALRVFDGRAAVRLLEADEPEGVFLLEGLKPGTMLSEIPEEEATQTAADLMLRLWRPVPEAGPFQTLAGWVGGFEKLRARFEGGTGPLPADLIDHAEKMAAELLASATPMLIHGDLHHFNILRAQREPWLAIDPKGLIGDPAYEPAPFLANPHLEDAETLSRRLDVFAEVLPVDRSRILAWAIVYAAMSAWWTIEDGGDWFSGTVELADRLSTLK